MNVVFLSPHYPPSYRHFCAALKARGARVFGIGDVAYDALGELKGSLDDYVQIHDLEHSDGAWRALGLLTWKHGRIAHLDSLNEHWLGLEARLREDFNIPGLKPADLRLARSKSGMAEVFARVGVPAPRTLLARTSDEVRAFVKEVGLPVIFKPDVGVGALNTFKVEDPAALDRVLSDLKPGYVVQPFVRGRITTFDGITDRNGEIRYISSFLYAHPALEMLGGRDVVYWSRREIPQELDRLGREVVKAFDSRGRFFHIEFFERDDGRYEALEINIRPPGGFSLDLMNYACDVDLYGVWADVVLGKDLSNFRYEHRYHAAHIGRRPAAYKFTPEQVAQKMGPALMRQLDVPGVIGETMGNPVFLIRHADEAELHRLVHLALERA